MADQQSEDEKTAAARRKQAQDKAQQQALAEAAERRAAVKAGPRPKEQGGQEGPEPTRYGDWETAGIVSDF